MQHSQSPDLMNLEGYLPTSTMEYSKMLLLPYQQQQHQQPHQSPAHLYQTPVVHLDQPAAIQYQEQVQLQVMEPGSQMLVASQSSSMTSTTNHHQQQLATTNRLQLQHPEQLHLHPSNQSVINKTRHSSLSHHLNRCHIHPARQAANSQALQTSARVRQLNSYMDSQNQQQQQVNLFHRQATTSDNLTINTNSTSSYAGSEPEFRMQYSAVGPRQRVGSVSSPGNEHSCLIPLSTVPQPSASSQIMQHSPMRATSAPQVNSYYGFSPKSSSGSSGSGSGGSMSPNGALSLGINLEQYISKRNERERSRVKNVNDAFDNLKCSLPLESEKACKRMSKVEILRTAIGYIRNLEAMLTEQQSSESTTTQQQHQQQQQQQQLVGGATNKVQVSGNNTYSNINSAIFTPETNTSTRSKIYLSNEHQQQQQQQHQHTTLTTGSDELIQVQTGMRPEQDYLDLMNSLEFEDLKPDY